MTYFSRALNRSLLEVSRKPFIFLIFSFVQFSGLVMLDPMQPHGLQHTRLHCPSPTPGVYSNSCPLSQWCHPMISSSVVSFSLQSCRASGSFPVGQFFTSGGQSVGQFSISHSNEHSGLISFRMDWFDFLAVQGTLRNLLQQLQFKSISSSVLSFIYGPTLTPYMTTGKTILWLDGPLLAK